jgi:hypothetical protein
MTRCAKCGLEFSYDPKTDHIDADAILLECVATFMPNVAMAYEKQRGTGWWYA